MSFEARCHGAVFSSLLQDINSSQSDCEGFIVGSIQEEMISENADSASFTRLDTVFHIQSFIPAGPLFSFYNTSCVIDDDKIRGLLGVRHQDTLGYYVFRRNSPITQSYRDRLLLQNLVARFPEKSRLLSCILTSSRTDNLSTISFDYQFATLDHSLARNPISLKILNLGQSNSRYIRTAFQSASHASTSLPTLLSPMTNLFVKSDGAFLGVSESDQAFSAVQQKLHALYEDVQCSCERIRQLQSEISLLRVEKLRSASSVSLANAMIAPPTYNPFTADSDLNPFLGDIDDS